MKGRRDASFPGSLFSPLNSPHFLGWAPQAPGVPRNYGVLPLPSQVGNYPLVHPDAGKSVPPAPARCGAPVEGSGVLDAYAHETFMALLIEGEA